MRILVAEDDAALASFLKKGLESEHYAVDLSADGEQARAMAAKNRFEHDAAGPFAQRVKRSGYDAKVAVENIGAGYHTLAEAFSGWRASPIPR